MHRNSVRFLDQYESLDRHREPRGELIAQYRPPMAFHYRKPLLIMNWTNPKKWEVCYLCVLSELWEKLDSFENYLNLLNHNFLVIELSETWLSNDDYDLYGLSGYNFIGNHRSNRIGGGVAICLKKNIAYTMRDDYPDLMTILNPFLLNIKKNKMAATNILSLKSSTIHLIKI